MAARSLLKQCFSLVPEYGFTRQTIARASEHAGQPLSETAISALFGNGTAAHRTLILAWLDEGISDMQQSRGVGPNPPTMSDVLKRRLEWNTPALHHLKDAFATLLVPDSLLTPLDPLPALKHSVSIADAACNVARDTSSSTSWYTRRAALAAVYGSAELHQLASPSTAPGFLDELLSQTSRTETMLSEGTQYGKWIANGWAGILRSHGVL